VETIANITGEEIRDLARKYLERDMIVEVVMG
jgi:hypothetical protein